MKNLLRNITLVVVSFLAFSCSEEHEVTNLKSTTITKLLKADATNPSAKYSYFVQALELTGKDDMLDASGDYTVIAPLDDAFYNFLGGYTVAEYEAANPGVLAAVVNNHIINTRVLSSSLTDGQSLTTSGTTTLVVDLQPNASYPERDPDLEIFEVTSIFLNGGRVYSRDAEASNGVIYSVDTVFAPGS